ncbi:hypothetical protein [Bradyrhizobium japonicum]|uniref:hypothetical protein n=1 Tax=Bradyrhizobium japonicum TaxID=375 RepID=UPI001FDA0E26|nr:hypothetical protein [Bradyrhizobium japonicum]
MTARNMLLIGLAGTGLGMMLQVFVQTYTQLVLLRLLIGFFDAGIFIGNMKLIFGCFRRAGAGRWSESSLRPTASPSPWISHSAFP